LAAIADRSRAKTSSFIESARNPTRN
jgi:hypothetical protein